jgi:hypothetical protein
LSLDAFRQELPIHWCYKCIADANLRGDVAIAILAIAEKSA